MNETLSDPSTEVKAANKPRVTMAVVIVFVAVVLNVLTGVLLKSLADRSQPTPIVLVIGIGLVLLINAGRFAVWAVANKRYPLSLTYPMSSLFYPLMLVVAVFYKEPIGFNQLLGTVLITGGVLWLSIKAAHWT